VNKTTLTTLPAALALALTLGACGGGDDPGPNPNPNPTPTASITACFTVDKAVTFAQTAFNVPSGYVASNRSTVEPATYNGEKATRQTFFYPVSATTTYTDMNYWTVTDSGVRSIAYVDYNGTATPTDWFFPKDMKPKDKVTDSNKIEYTLVGFETISLAGKTFSNTCHIKVVDPEGNSDEVWYASGYGVIKDVNPNGGVIQYNGDI